MAESNQVCNDKSYFITFCDMIKIKLCNNVKGTIPCLPSSDESIQTIEKSGSLLRKSTEQLIVLPPDG
jgi:hypothetical protein